MQRRQLDRNAGPLDRPAPTRALPDRGDRPQISVGVARRIFRRARGFAEHVERVAPSLLPLLSGAVERLLDRAAHDELPAQDAHRAGHCLPHHRLALAAHDMAQRGGEAGLRDIFFTKQPSSERQAPGGGIDQDRRAAADVLLPIAGPELVADQTVGGLGVGDPQERLGQAHERDALGGVELVFLKQRLDAEPGCRPGPHLGHQPRRGGRDLRPIRCTKRRRCRRGPHGLPFIGHERVTDPLPSGIRFRKRLVEDHGTRRQAGPKP